MKTKIFKSKEHFDKRKDKRINGVDRNFATRCGDYELRNLTNQGCWNCLECTSCIDCVECYRCELSSNLTFCSELYACKNCESCYCCSKLTGKKFQAHNSDFPKIPVIANIHQSVRKAVLAPKSLSMIYWHTCESTHCWAGWITRLAGDRGEILESLFGTAVAALMILDKSSEVKVNPMNFYTSERQARFQINRLAEQEAAAKP